MKILNNKGFTLVEVLAVLVILVAISAIAIPTITSSMERTKEKQNDAKKEMLASYAEEYVEDYKNEIYNNLGTSNECYIELDELTENGYIKNDAELDIDGNKINGYIIFDKSNNSYRYSDEKNVSSCISKDQNDNIESSKNFLNKQEKGKYVYYKDSAEWMIAYTKDESAHLVSTTAVGHNQTLNAIYNIASGYCNNNNPSYGLCNDSWPMGPNDFEGITGYKIDNMSCYGSSATNDCSDKYDNLIKIKNQEQYYFIDNTNVLYIFKFSYLEKIETYNKINGIGFRIVIKMNPDILVTDGDGSKENPYIIEKAN